MFLISTKTFDNEKGFSFLCKSIHKRQVTGEKNDNICKAKGTRPNS